jgi:hypothetical protein
MVDKWGHKKDSVHMIVKHLSHGGQIHSFTNPGGRLYVAVYDKQGNECGSLDCVNYSQKEAIKLLSERWKGEHLTYDCRNEDMSMDIQTARKYKESALKRIADNNALAARYGEGYYDGYRDGYDTAMKDFLIHGRGDDKHE